MAAENLLYNNETDTIDASTRLAFSVFAAVKPLKDLSHILGPVCILSEALIGFASGGSQLYYTARYAKANHIRKGTLAGTNILTSALLIAASASSLAIGGAFGFAGAMWYMTARSAETAYRAKQKMDLRYLFDNRLEKLHFVCNKLQQTDLDIAETLRLEAIKKRLEIQLLAIAVETFNVKNRLEKAIGNDKLDENKKLQYTKEKEKFEDYHGYFIYKINNLAPAHRTVDDVDDDSSTDDDDAANNMAKKHDSFQSNNPYVQLIAAYKYAISSKTLPKADEDEEDDENVATPLPNHEDIPIHLHMSGSKAQTITQYLYNKQREKYIAKTRKTLIWGVSAIGLTLIAVSVVCPHAAPILAPLGLSFCLAAAALKAYDFYQDFSSWRARCRLERQVLRRMTQESAVPEHEEIAITTTPPAIVSSLSTTAGPPTDEQGTLSIETTSPNDMSASSDGEESPSDKGSSSNEDTLSTPPTDQGSSDSGNNIDALSGTSPDMPPLIAAANSDNSDEDNIEAGSFLSTASSLTGSATDEYMSCSVVVDNNDNAAPITPNLIYTPAPSISAKLYAFFSSKALPIDFEAEVRREALARCKKHRVIEETLDENALSDKDFKQLKTLAGELPADEETQASRSIFAC